LRQGKSRLTPCSENPKRRHERLNTKQKLQLEPEIQVGKTVRARIFLAVATGLRPAEQHLLDGNQREPIALITKRRDLVGD
jgi:hypothetical protein